MESRLRMLLVLAGIPEPQVNFKLYFEDGSVRYRLDLSWPDLRIVVEYDGRHHVERTRQWHSDIDRREELESMGWTFVVVTSDGIYQNPEVTIRRVAAKLRGRGVRVDRINPGWRTHFPGR